MDAAGLLVLSSALVLGHQTALVLDGNSAGAMGQALGSASDGSRGWERDSAWEDRSAGRTDGVWETVKGW